MEVIKNLFDSNERFLWEKTVAKDKPQERHYVITNKRVYKKSQDIPDKNFSGAPKDYLEVKGDILIIERVGIKRIKSRERKSLLQRILKGIAKTKEGIEKPEKIKEEIEKAKESIERGEVPKFSTDKESIIDKEKIQKLAKKLIKFLNRDKMFLYLHNASNRAFMVIDRLSAEESKIISEILLNIEDIPASSYEPSPFQSTYSGTSYASDYPEESPDIMRRVVTRRPSEVDHAAPSSSEEHYIQPTLQNSSMPPPQETYLTPTFKEDKISANTCQIIEITDNNLFQGKICTYCGNALVTYEEKTFSCKGCGAFYHENCLDNLMREGICIKCNKILIF